MSKLTDSINKARQDKTKLRNSAPTQAISPLTERVFNNNTNPDSLKMVGTANATQGAATQAAKDQQAVATGAMAQDPLAMQQAQAEQQRGLREDSQTLQDFQSQAIEIAQDNINKKAQEWSQSMAGFGSLGERVAAATRAELTQAALNQDAQLEFQAEAEELDQIAESLLRPDQIDTGRPIIESVINSLINGDTDAALAALGENSKLFKTGEGSSAEANQQVMNEIFKALDLPPSLQQTMISSALAKGIIDPDNMTMDYLFQSGILSEQEGEIPELDMSVSDLNEIFGKDKWKSMTVDDIEQALYDDFDEQSQREEILRQLENQNISPTRRQELLRELSVLDASGVTEAEASVKRTMAQVAASDKIQMGDRLVNIDEVIDDKNLRDTSNALIQRLQAATPEELEAEFEAWKKENPGYEELGQWVKENLSTLEGEARELDDIKDVVKEKTKKAEEFVTDNEVFGEGAEEIMKLLGAETEGLAVLANNPESLEKYQHFKAFYTKAQNDPILKDQWNLFVSNLKNISPEDMQGLQDANVEDLVKTLGTEAGWRKFNYLRDLNNKLNTTDASNLKDLAYAVFPEGSPLREVVSNPEMAESYYEELKKISALSNATYRDWRTGRTKKRYPDLPNVDAQLKQFKELMDADGDGQIDDPTTLSETIKELMGDGFNISNFTSDEAGKLWDLTNQAKTQSEEILTTASQQWKTNVFDKAQDEWTQAQTLINDTDADKPYIKEPSVGNFYNTHKSRNKWKKQFDPGKLGPGEAQKAGAQIFNFMVSNNQSPEMMAKSLTKAYASGKPTSWWKQNIGLPNPKGNHSGQVSQMIMNIARAGGYKFGKGRPTTAQITKGLQSLFGNDYQEFNLDKNRYKAAARKRDPKTLKNPFET